MSGEVRPVPAWARELGELAREMKVPAVLRPPTRGGRRAAVLVLLTEGDRGPELLLIRRSAHLRLHPGESAFPGGVIEATDDSAVTAALREAREEIALAPDDVEVLEVLPELYIPPSKFRVIPVLAWLRDTHRLRVNADEVEFLVWTTFDELADPAKRLMLHRPEGIVLPAFQVRGDLVWGLTATVIDRLLSLSCRERRWDVTVVDTLKEVLD